MIISIDAEKTFDKPQHHAGMGQQPCQPAAPQGLAHGRLGKRGRKAGLTGGAMSAHGQYL